MNDSHRGGAGRADTGSIAASLGGHVIRPSANTGLRASVLNVGLPHVETEWLVTLDADTILAPDALERIVDVAREEGAAAACGMFLSQQIRSFPAR